MLFVGVDQSLNHTGLCILDEQGVPLQYQLIEPKKRTGHERLAYIRDALRATFKDKRFGAGVLEGYSMGSINRKFDLGEVGAVVKLELFDACQGVYIAAPTQLKLYVTQKGSASKEDVMKAIKAQWGIEIKNDNLADAFGLANIAKELVVTTTTKRHQLDVVNAIRGTLMTSQEAKKPPLSRQFKGAI